MPRLNSGWCGKRQHAQADARGGAADTGFVRPHIDDLAANDRCLQQKGIAPAKLAGIPQLDRYAAPSSLGSNQTSFRADLGLKPTDIVALYSGAMSNKQGLELIIEAAAATADSHPSLQFVLCGNGPVKPALMQTGERPCATCTSLNCSRRSASPNCSVPRTFTCCRKRPRSPIWCCRPNLRACWHQDDRSSPWLLRARASPRRWRAPASSSRRATRRRWQPQLLRWPETSALRASLGAVARARAEQKWDRVSIIRSLELEFLALPQGARLPPLARASPPNRFVPSNKSRPAAAAGRNSLNRTLATHLRQPVRWLRSSKE